MDLHIELIFEAKTDSYIVGNIEHVINKGKNTNKWYKNSACKSMYFDVEHDYGNSYRIVYNIEFEDNYKVNEYAIIDGFIDDLLDAASENEHWGIKHWECYNSYVDWGKLEFYE